MARNTILVVDDNEDIVATIRLILEALGWRVVFAYSVEAALQVFSVESGRLAAVLCDKHMGRGERGENGHALYRDRALVLREDRIPFVQMSGVIDPDFLKECQRMGMHGLRKPFGYSRLISFLEGIIPAERWPAQKPGDA